MEAQALALAEDDGVRDALLRPTEDAGVEPYSTGGLAWAGPGRAGLRRADRRRSRRPCGASHSFGRIRATASPDEP